MTEESATIERRTPNAERRTPNAELVSFCLITYQQENFIEDAVRGALSQTYSPLEIIISDDCSTDKTFERIQEITKNYTGPHKIIINKNEKNLGIREHCNKVLYDIAHGEYIIMAAGDDVSDSRRTEIYVDYFKRFPEVTSISCKSKEVKEDLSGLNEQDEWDGNFSVLNVNDYIAFRDFVIFSGDSRGLRRSVINKFPKLKYPSAEDIYIFIRSLLIGSVCYIRQPLVLRRHHANNVSNKVSKHHDIFLKQVLEDVDYAAEKGYITAMQKINMYSKVKHVFDLFEIYWQPPFSSLKIFFFKALRKFLKLQLY